MTTTDVVLLVLENDVENPELSIVVPALNEEITISRFVDWCKQGISAAGFAGETLFIDSPTDRSPSSRLAVARRIFSR
jgi:hypothetical protein